MSQKQLNEMTLQLKSRKKTITFLLLLLLITLIALSKSLFPHIHLNKQILSQYTNKILGITRKTRGL